MSRCITRRRKKVKDAISEVKVMLRGKGEKEFGIYDGKRGSSTTEQENRKAISEKGKGACSISDLV